MRVTLFLSWLLILPLRSQFYAPETDFHDVAQRRFPVEAARILAWMQTADPIDEVVYGVTTTPKRETVWNIEWRNGDAAVRKVTLKYPETTLIRGADWYREVWRQLAPQDWLPAQKGELGEAFWLGAEEAGISRMEAIGNGLKRTEAGAPPDAAGSARLAGSLVQAALPSTASRVSLDSTVLARAAVWLCVAEQQAGKPAGAEWAPILALANREALAKAAWPAIPADARPVVRAWDVLVRMPAPAEALTFIARPENRLYAAPVFSTYTSIDHEYMKILVTFARDLYPGDLWKRLHDYGPSLNHATDNRMPIAMDAPMHSTRAWLGVLQTVTSTAPAGESRERIAALVKDYATRPTDLAAPSADLARLLNAGAASGLSLPPVGVVTPGDLLSFAWEFGGRQIGAIHSRCSTLLRGREKSRELEGTWLDRIKGWAPFTMNLKIEPFEPLADTSRYEGITSTHIAKELISNPPKAWRDDPDPATIYFRRRWLMDAHRALEHLVFNNGKPEVAAALLRRAAREGGSASLGALVMMTNRYTSAPAGVQWRYDEAVDTLEMREELLRAVPHSIAGRRELLARKFGDDPFALAQALERLHWETGVAFDPDGVFMNYLRANALDSARRFYDRWHPAIPNAYEFKRTFGPAHHAVCVLENDMERAERTLQQMGGGFSRIPDVASALLEDDFDGARKIMDEHIKRYPRIQHFPALREYLPLIPALNDAKHPEHQRALDSFPRTPVLNFIAWVLLRKAALPPAEAVRFLGGAEADPEAQLLIAAVQKDRRRFETLYRELLGPRPDPTEVMIYDETNRRLPDSKGALYVWLRNQLLEIKPPKEQPDLRPGNALPLMLQLRAVAAAPTAPVAPPTQFEAKLIGTQWSFPMNDKPQEQQWVGFEPDGKLAVGWNPGADRPWKVTGENTVEIRPMGNQRAKYGIQFEPDLKGARLISGDRGKVAIERRK